MTRTRVSYDYGSWEVPWSRFFCESDSTNGIIISQEDAASGYRALWFAPMVRGITVTLEAV